MMQKYDLQRDYKVQKLVDAHEQQKENLESRSREELKEMSYGRSTMLQLRHSDLHGKVYHSSIFRIWTCRFRGCQRATQRVHKINLSDMHRQAYTYQKVCRVLKSCNHTMNNKHKW